jgi:hypothetical protein
VNFQPGGGSKAATIFLRIRKSMACAVALAAGFALSAPAAAQAAQKKNTETTQAAPEEETAKSEAASRVIEWVAASGDNGELPYMIVDKQAARLFLFDAMGKPLGDAPVLVGIATGDEATPGVGAKKLAEIGPAEKTTPAGRFVAKFGRAVGKQRVLWVDYYTSVALHAVVTSNKKERRVQRLASPEVDDNRITFGCINVPTAFYSKRVSPLFRKAGGIVYVLPDSKPLEEVFPRLRLLPYLDKPAQDHGAPPLAQN